MHHKDLILAIGIFILSTLKISGQVHDIMDYSHSADYANYLFSNKQYQYSAIEYERTTFLNPFDTLAKIRLIQSYRLLDDLKSANNCFEKFFSGDKLKYPEAFALEYVKLLFQEKRFIDVSCFIEGCQTISLSNKAKYEVGALLLQYRWEEAKTLTNEYFNSNQKTQTVDDLYNISLQGLNIRYKSPCCAALMSTIIPGSGKVYTKQWKDGIYAFLFISAFSYLTYNSITHNGLNAGSILYGSIALSFYTANIFGSYKSAKRYNQKENNLITRDIENFILK